MKYSREFTEWYFGGNVIQIESNLYATQDANYKNRIKGMGNLQRYFNTELQN